MAKMSDLDLAVAIKMALSIASGRIASFAKIHTELREAIQGAANFPNFLHKKSVTWKSPPQQESAF